MKTLEIKRHDIRNISRSNVLRVESYAIPSFYDGYENIIYNLSRKRFRLQYTEIIKLE